MRWKHGAVTLDGRRLETSFVLLGAGAPLCDVPKHTAFTSKIEIEGQFFSLDETRVQQHVDRKTVGLKPVAVPPAATKARGQSGK